MKKVKGMSKQVLDPCCGSKMFYFQKDHQDVLYGDIRSEEHVLCDGRTLKVAPDTILDFRHLPFADESFYHVCFDPPHLRWAGDNSWMKKKYGSLNKATWEEDLRQGFNECWRVLKPGGTLIFKWSEIQIKINRVLACFSQSPLYGHPTTKNLKTHWMVFYKPVEDEFRLTLNIDHKSANPQDILDAFQVIYNCGKSESEKIKDNGWISVSKKPEEDPALLCIRNSG